MRLSAVSVSWVLLLPGLLQAELSLQHGHQPGIDHPQELTADEDRLAKAAQERKRLSEKIARLEADVVKGRADLDTVGSNGFYKHALAALCCVILAGLAAGLTMGLVSIDPREMNIIVNTEQKDVSNEKERRKLKEDQAAAKRVLPLIRDHHRLLVTLLLLNSIANEALPIFLDCLVPSWLAVLLSVTLVLMFGEIIPSAIFTGSEQLGIAAKFVPLVSCLRILLAPVAYPIAKVLDYLLGEDHKGRYNFAELRAIVGIHANLRQEDAQAAVTFKCHDDKGCGIITTTRPHHFTDESIVVFADGQDVEAQFVPARSTKLKQDREYYVSPCEPLQGRDSSYTFKLYVEERRAPRDLVTFAEGELTSGTFLLQERDEIKIMHGVMKLTHMSVRDNLKALSEVDMLECREELTKESLVRILYWGHSRVPVYSGDKHNIRGFILTKKLIVVSPQEGKRVENCHIQRPVLVEPNMMMLDLLNEFQAHRCHIALVTNWPQVVESCWTNNCDVPPDVHMMGIITLEDIIEKLIQEDIYDEHDSPSRGPSTRSIKSPSVKTRKSAVWTTAKPR